METFNAMAQSAIETAQTVGNGYFETVPFAWQLVVLVPAVLIAAIAFYRVLCSSVNF